MKVCIVSRDRMAFMTTHILFPDASIVCPESQYVGYSKVVPKKRLITCPDGCNTIAKVRNFVVSMFGKRGVFMLDDDINKCYSNMSDLRIPINESSGLMSILDGCMTCAADIGAMMCGFSRLSLAVGYDPSEPFKLHHWIDCVVGVIGTDRGWWDEGLIMHADVDASIQAIRRDGKVWIDERYWFRHDRDTMPGGQSKHKTMEAVMSAAERFNRKWNPYALAVYDAFAATNSIRWRITKKQKLAMRRKSIKSGVARSGVRMPCEATEGSPLGPVEGARG